MISFDLEILFKCVVIRSSRVCRPAKNNMLKNGQVQKNVHKIFKNCSFYQIFLHIKAKRCGNILKLKESLVVRKSDQIMKLKLGDRIRHTTELGTPMISNSVSFGSSEIEHSARYQRVRSSSPCRSNFSEIDTLY